VQVIDVAHVLAMPWTTYVLTDSGGEVISDRDAFFLSSPR
jgi:crotonobetainyl-CoA:carnitine CoA-transferase CaiB-like acyl-CoA transferase